jgi:hypothetical protein
MWEGLAPTMPLPHPRGDAATELPPPPLVFLLRPHLSRSRSHILPPHPMDGPFDPHIRRVLHRDQATIQELEKLARKELERYPLHHLGR